LISIFVDRKEMLNRLTDLQNPGIMNGNEGLPSAPPAPPSYEEATSMSNSSLSPTSLSPSCPYSALNNTLQELKVETGATFGNILYVQDKVRMYFISPDGRVGSLSDPAPLTIAQIQG
jgi:hypothetical protein